MNELREEEFKLIQKIVYESCGIALGENKKSMVRSRLYKRLLHHKLKSYAQYIRLVQLDTKEKNEMINQITTNETYFFREKAHLEFLKSHVPLLLRRDEPVRIWSAAASVGAEAYSIAMVMEDMTTNYEILGTDINSDVLEKAKIGLYPEKWTRHIPPHYLKCYCLKGKGPYEGQFLVDRTLQKRVRFERNNLLDRRSDFGFFDFIFLRNVLLYFDTPTKQKVVENVLSNLHRGGYLFISLTENLNDLHLPQLRQVETSVFEKVM